MYWANASTQLTPEVWRAREVDDDDDITGGPVENVPIKVRIEPGEYAIIRQRWLLPSKLERYPDGNFHFCLLAKIVDKPEDDRYVPGERTFDILGSNKQAQKNVTIIRKNDLSKGAYVYVRNGSSSPKSYTLELVPAKASDAAIYSAAKVEMELSQKIYSAWERGGLQSQDIEVPAYQPNSPMRTVRFASPQSQLRQLHLNENEFDVVRLKFDFGYFKADDQKYTLDLIQKDENGNIVGGETFIVEAPAMSGSIIIKPTCLTNGQYQLELDTDGYNSINWLDHRGETLGRQETIVVTPRVNSHDYSVVATVENGDIVTGSISLGEEYGFESITQSLDGSLLVVLKNDAASQSLLSVASVTGNGPKVSYQIAEGTRNFYVDVSGLTSGVYVVSYYSNSKLIDQKKVKIE